MKGHRIWLAVVAMAALMVAPAQAEDFWGSLKKDFKGLTGAIKEGIDDITEGKKEVEGVIDDAKQLQEEFADTPENEPRYDSAWIAELQQRLTAEGFDPGPVDGAFGNRTSQAVSAFQRQAGISPDGLPRPTVMRSLRARTQGIQIAQPSPEPQSGGHTPPPGDTAAWPPSTAGPTGQAMSGEAGTGTPPPGQVSPVSAGSQDATYARFLEAHLALHPDVVEDDAFALQYLSYLPADQDCPAEFELLEGSEFDRQRFFTQVWPAWKARFAETVSRARPPGADVFRIEVERTAGAYDFSTGAFAVVFAQPPADFTVGESRSFSYSGGMRFCTSPSGPGRFPVGFAIKLVNGDAIDRLPLSAAEAEAFDERSPERKLQFVVEFVLEETAPAGHVGGAGQGTGRLVGAAVVDPISKQMLHRYDPAIFAPPSADPWDAFPAPDYRRLLLTLVARSPDLARSDAYVERFAAIQVCDALRATQGNEIGRQQLIAEWQPRFEREAAEAHDPRAPIVKLTLEQKLGEYDIVRQAFAFPDNNGLNRHQPTRIQAAGAWCPTASSDAPGAFWIVLEPPKALFQAGLPVAPDIAQRLLDSETRGRKRTVHLDLLLELGVPGQLDGNPSQLPATIVDARVRELDARTVLHHYGTGFFAADAAPADPYAGIEDVSHERLTLAYLAAQPQLADDRAFAQRYAAATSCEAWSARRGDEFARAELGDQARQQIRDALAQAAGGSSAARHRVSIEAKLGEYDFASGRFPLAVPVFDQKIYRNLLDAPLPALLMEHDGKACSRDSVVSPSFPDAFLLTLAGAEAIDSAGVPADQSSARAFLQRDLPPYRDPRAVRIEMVVSVGAIGLPRRTHPQRDEHVSIVAGTVVDARVLDAHSGQPVFDYGPDLFGGAPEAEAGPAPVPTPPPVPEGAEFVLVSVAEPADLEAYAVIEGSGLDLQKGERINGKFVFNYDASTDLWAYLSSSPKVGIVLSAEQFARAAGELAALDLRVEAYRPGGDASNELKAQPIAALPVAPATGAMADERGADEFKVLNVTVGMTEAEVSAAIAGEFSADQIATDPKSGALLAKRGPCNDADPADPAIASESGVFCLEVQLTDGVVSRVALRQVVPGDVSKRAVAAFSERYGEPAFEDHFQPSPSVQRTVIGWGRSLAGSPLDLAGIDPDAPRTVLEGHVWRSNGVTVVVLRLDEGRPAESSDSLAAGQEIKF